MTAAHHPGKPPSSCADCLAWGWHGLRRCAACTMFRTPARARVNAPDAGECRLSRTELTVEVAARNHPLAGNAIFHSNCGNYTILLPFP
jgi:hypothetical protein